MRTPCLKTTPHDDFPSVAPFCPSSAPAFQQLWNVRRGSLEARIDSTKDLGQKMGSYFLPLIFCHQNQTPREPVLPSDSGSCGTANASTRRRKTLFGSRRQLALRFVFAVAGAGPWMVLRSTMALWRGWRCCGTRRGINRGALPLSVCQLQAFRS